MAIYATANKKMLNMLILDILKEYSDEKHRLTQQEIIRLLISYVLWVIDIFRQRLLIFIIFQNYIMLIISN